MPAVGCRTRAGAGKSLTGRCRQGKRVQSRRCTAIQVAEIRSSQSVEVAEDQRPNRSFPRSHRRHRTGADRAKVGPMVREEGPWALEGPSCATASHGSDVPSQTKIR
jgi:hypothetical protein